MKTKLALALILVAATAHAEDDPRKLAEAGFKAFQKKDFATAEKLTRDAIAKSPNDEDVRGAALYNLGQILEGKQDKAGAAQAYKDSLAIRKNGIVRDALRVLDPAAADASDAYVPKLMQGPFDNMPAYCTNWLETPPVQMSKESLAQYVPECAKSPVIKAKKAFKPPAGFDSLELVKLYTEDFLVRATIGGKLYITQLSPFQQSGMCQNGVVTLDGATMHGAAIVLDYGITGDCADRDSSVKYEEKGIIVVGLGGSKKPSVTELRSSAIERDGKKKTFDQTRKLTWNKDNTGVDVVILTNSGDAFLLGGHHETNDIRGHHTIAFP